MLVRSRLAPTPLRERALACPARSAPDPLLPTVLAALLLASSAATVDAQKRGRGAAADATEETQTEEVQPTPLLPGMKWRNIGPFRGGRSNASTGVIGDRDTHYFGGVGSGVWKTTDRGESWTNVSDDTFQTASVGAIAVAPSDPNVVYVGMGEHAIRGVMTSHGDGMYRSVDAGKSWQKLGLELTRHISEVLVHPSDPDVVYVAAQGAAHGPNAERGVYRSTDGGTTWEHVLFVSESAGASGLSFDPSNPRTIYAAFWDHIRLPWQVRSGGPGSGIWKSTDGGDSWTRLGETVEKGLPALKGKIDVSAASPDRVYALIEADPKGGLYRSDDGGTTWSLINEDWGIRARAWYYIKVYADPTDPDHVWITNAQLYSSIDGGRSFRSVRVPHGDNHHLWIDPDDPKHLINSNDGGANISFNGGRSWSTQQNQPTAQFYRVNVDNQFPYHVYGGQQDNSAIGIVNRAPGGVGWSDFYSVAGCESAWAAFDEDDPRYVYGGCYMGILEEWDRETGSGRDIMAYPVMPAAIAARDMKYRFNWSSPVVASPFDPSVIYHAGNIVLKTTDRGVNWTEISGDLSRDDDEKQGSGGGPITNEGAGGEIYGTVYTLAASRLERGLLWAATDDGRVHLTRDDGDSWQDVSPAEVGEAMVNAIEASPHDPARAYIAVARAKFNDFRPMAYKTDDFGATWTAIADGIREDSWVRVVREDPVREGLLYMGTEHGVQVSFDDGGSWRPLMTGFPVAAITDLIVQRRDNDLVASTAGRGFWILDDISPLQQVDATQFDGVDQPVIFEPEPGVRAGGGGFRLPTGRVGANPPGPVTIDFLLPELEDSATVELAFIDREGSEIRRLRGEVDRGGRERPPADPGNPTTDDAPSPGETGAEDDGAGESEVEDASAAEALEEEADAEKTPYDAAEKAQIGKFQRRAGHNRVAWNLRHDPVLGVPGLYVFGTLAGRPVVPGEVTVELRVDVDGDGPIEQTVTATKLLVEPDPREDSSQAGYEEQDALARQVAEQVESIHRAVLQLRDVRSQVQRWTAALDDQGGDLAQQGEDLAEDLTEIEDRLIQKRTVDGQTVINFPMRLNQFSIYLHMAVASAQGVVNEGARTRYRDLEEDWQAVRGDLERLLGEDLEAFNAALRERPGDAVRVR